jgi:dihydroorotate dehydrogenase
MIYRALKPLLFLLPPEAAHHFAFGALRAAASFAPLERAMRSIAAPRDPALEVGALGVRFSSPVGLAAGFDKDAIGFDALGSIGFAFVEVGTLTARAQAGNPKPRMFRLSADRALVNRMGFNNRGAADAVERLAAKRGAVRLGVNIGKSKATAEENAKDDYAESAALLAPYADYLVVNVSSPNTPGLRNLQSVDKLRPILSAVRDAASRDGECPPLLVKIAPDLSDEDVDAVADLALDLGLDGIVATNTTLSRAGLRTKEARVSAIGAGGLSGAPLKARALEVLARLRRRVGDRTLLIASGGIEDADDAWERIVHGATLVQLYTGFIYGGPLTAKTIALGLAERAHAKGFARVQDAVGSKVDRSLRERRMEN